MTNGELAPMYVPPLNSILRGLGLDRESFERTGKVVMPKEMFRLLLHMALANCSFDEAGYLRDNPDVAAAVRNGAVADAWSHYLGFGYFEGRTGSPAVNEAWYLETYADVAQAVKRGRVGSAKEHYNAVGAPEGRSPNAAFLEAAELWKKALVGERVL
jgi:hypothetical protein